MSIDLTSIQPVVLVGGSSRRFGRDKLREPLDGSGAEWLVDRSIAALRAVFGPRVGAVGACDPRVAERADLTIPDTRPGVGPIGGILSAMEFTRADVFVLAGDLPDITPASVRAVLAGAGEDSTALAAIAVTDRPHPCIGLYRQGALTSLLGWYAAGGRSLHDAIPRDRCLRVPIDAGAARNINRPTTPGGL